MVTHYRESSPCLLLPFEGSHQRHNDANQNIGKPRHHGQKQRRTRELVHSKNRSSYPLPHVKHFNKCKRQVTPWKHACIKFAKLKQNNDIPIKKCKQRTQNTEETPKTAHHGNLPSFDKIENEDEQHESKIYQCDMYGSTSFLMQNDIYSNEARQSVNISRNEIEKAPKYERLQQHNQYSSIVIDEDPVQVNHESHRVVRTDPDNNENDNINDKTYINNEKDALCDSTVIEAILELEGKPINVDKVKTPLEHIVPMVENVPSDTHQNSDDDLNDIDLSPALQMFGEGYDNDDHNQFKEEDNISSLNSMLDCQDLVILDDEEGSHSNTSVETDGGVTSYRRIEPYDGQVPQIFSEEGTSIDEFASDIANAVDEANKTQSITPILKRELQYKIQVERLDRGEEELCLEADEPKKYTLTEDEIRKKNARREQNRKSAVKSRKKEREREVYLSNKINKMAHENTELLREKSNLSKARTDLLKKVYEHRQFCPNIGWPKGKQEAFLSIYNIHTALI